MSVPAASYCGAFYILTVAHHVLPSLIPCAVSLSSTWQNIRALVVGINDYKPGSGLSELKNAVPDARAMKKLLRGQGVDVFYGENVTIKEFRTLEEKFLDSLQKGDIGIVSFSGHAYMCNNASQLITVTDVEPRIEDHAVNVLKLHIRLTQRRCACLRASTPHVAISPNLG